MAGQRLFMRQIREILRQKWVLGRSHREVARSLGLSVGMVSTTLQRAREAGLDWAGAETLAEPELERRLYRAARGGGGLSSAAGLCLAAHGAPAGGGDARAAPPRVPGAASGGVSVHAVLRVLPALVPQAAALNASAPPGRREAVRGLRGQEAADREPGDGRGAGGGALRRGPGGVELHVRGGDTEPAVGGLHGQPHAGARVLRGGCPSS